MIENCWSALMIVTNKTQSIHLPKSLLSLQTTFHLYLFQQKKNAIKKIGYCLLLQRNVEVNHQDSN